MLNMGDRLDDVLFGNCPANVNENVNDVSDP